MLPVRADVGVNVAELPLALTVPITAAPPAVGRRIKLPAFNVETVMVREKVADTEEFKPTPLALCTGEVEDTAGGATAVADMTTTVCPDSSLGCSPPQPNRPRVANRAA